jgi:hypothetical protein
VAAPADGIRLTDADGSEAPTKMTHGR